MIATGKSVKEMGAELFMASVKTISTYRARLFEKLKFKSDADVVRYVLSEAVDGLKRGLTHKGVFSGASCARGSFYLRVSSLKCRTNLTRELAIG